MNCFSTICGPLPPSFLDLRAIVEPNDHIKKLKNGTVSVPSTTRYPLEENHRYTANNNVLESLHPLLS